MIEWNFDQGRLDYFQFDEIKKIAKGLYAINQQKKPTSKENDTIRLSLSAETDLPFSPMSYMVWRNYGRVFKSLLLAAEYNDLIVTTDLCYHLASNEINCDDYLLHFSNNFYYPSPAFSHYRPCQDRIYPVIAIIRTLISKFREKGINFLGMDEIYYKIASNNQINGINHISFSQLQRTNQKSISQSNIRQIRELVRFISQFSFLSFYRNKLYLDTLDLRELNILESQFVANAQIQELESNLEIIKLGKTNNNFMIVGNGYSLSSDDRLFSEGSKVKLTHLVTERNSSLRKLYFEKTLDAPICRMCGLDTQKSYEWSDNVIEIHHLLPLSSPIRMESQATSLRDLVGVCPTCHRAIHKYYTLWLNTHHQNDFNSYDEAYFVYQEVKSKVKRIY